MSLSCAIKVYYADHFRISTRLSRYTSRESGLMLLFLMTALVSGIYLSNVTVQGLVTVQYM